MSTGETKPWDKVRFPPKPPLKRKGRLNKKQLTEFFRKCETMLLSGESTQLLYQARMAGKDINKLCVKWQHEMFEHLGIHRDFGVDSLKNIQVNFPSDKSMPHLLMKFARICQMSVMKAMMPQARAGEEKRRYKPASKLINNPGGVMPAHAILKFFRKCSEELRSPETAKLLRKANGEGKDLQKLSIRWQREIIELLGYDQEFGVNSMMMMPLFYSQDRRLMVEMQLFQQTCQRVVQQAKAPSMIADLDPSKRRFKPKSGKLISSGKLSRKHYIQFFKECQKVLASEESISILKHAKRQGKNPGLVSVQWQREIFESLGVEQDFGVESLNRLAIDFPNDKEIQTEMVKFAKACAQIIKKVDPEGAKKALELNKRRVEEAKLRMKKPMTLQERPKPSEETVEGEIVGPANPVEKETSKPTKSKKEADDEEMAMMLMMLAMEEEKKAKEGQKK